MNLLIWRCCVLKMVLSAECRVLLLWGHCQLWVRVL